MIHSCWPGSRAPCTISPSRTHDADGTFQQFYDGLKLPDSFGWNWDALSDCLRDLRWLSVDHHVVVIEAADRALPDDAAERRLLFETLLWAGRRWSFTRNPEGVESGRLVLVMTCDTASVASLKDQLRSCLDATRPAPGRP
ncbi:barstar family protein [Streptomyces zhihengii]